MVKTITTKGRIVIAKKVFTVQMATEKIIKIRTFLHKMKMGRKMKS